jgi:hypothetical protein
MVGGKQQLTGEQCIDVAVAALFVAALTRLMLVNCACVIEDHRRNKLIQVYVNGRRHGWGSCSKEFDSPHLDLLNRGVA